MAQPVQGVEQMNAIYALTACVLVGFYIFGAQAIVSASRDRMKKLRNFYPVKPSPALWARYGEAGEMFTPWRKVDRAPRDLVVLAMRSEKAQRWIQ